MSAKDPRRLRVGARIGSDLTVLGHVDKQERNPVYIVWHHRAWCPMACKVFRSRQRAKREADILARFAHPNTVRFLGLGKPAHMLMEFLEGPALSRVIDDGKNGCMSVSNAARVAIHLGAALHHVHDEGFIHLDVKPSNAIVVNGRPILFDFGSARPQGDSRPAKIAGTDPYIAPEECQRGIVTPKADVFGLGATLYEMLTGKLPFPKGTRRIPFPQTSLDPIPLRERKPSLPRALDRLVLSCLARRPEDRPEIADLLMALNGFIRAGPRMWPESFTPRRNRSRR